MGARRPNRPSTISSIRPENLEWEETTFRRIECIAENPSDALQAVDERLRKMRRDGWLIPHDAVVDLRPSGFGWAARLASSNRSEQIHGWKLRRRVRRKARTVSGVEMPVVELDMLREA